MESTKKLPIQSILMLPGQPVQFNLYDATVIVAPRMRGSVMQIDYQCIKQIPPLLDVQKN